MNVRRESRHEVVETLREQYGGASRPAKQEIIDQAMQLTGYDRGYVRRLLRNGVPKKDPAHRSAGRGHTYKHTITDALIVASEAPGWICSKRLVAVLPDLVPALEKENTLALTVSHRAQLLALSASTIDQRLASERRAHRPRGRTTTCAGSLLRSQLPIRTFTPWADEAPGSLLQNFAMHPRYL